MIDTAFKLLFFVFCFEKLFIPKQINPHNFKFMKKERKKHKKHKRNRIFYPLTADGADKYSQL